MLLRSSLTLRVQDKPNDREVEELLEIFEKTEAPILRAVEERIHWQTGTPTRAMRIMLIAGVVAMCIACTGVRYYGSKCFLVRRFSGRMSLSRALTLPYARLEQPFQINDAVACQNPDVPRHPRHLQARKCLDGHAERLVRMEGWGALLLFFFGFICYRVRSVWRLLEHSCLRTRSLPHTHRAFSTRAIASS